MRSSPDKLYGIVQSIIARPEAKPEDREYELWFIRNELMQALHQHKHPKHDPMEGISKDFRDFAKQYLVYEEDLPHRHSEISKPHSCPICKNEVIGEGLFDKNMDGNPATFFACMKCGWQSIKTL